jgi:hypothetical protein
MFLSFRAYATFIRKEDFQLLAFFSVFVRCLIISGRVDSIISVQILRKRRKVGSSYHMETDIWNCFPFPEITKWLWKLKTFKETAKYSWTRLKDH